MLCYLKSIPLHIATTLFFTGATQLWGDTSTGGAPNSPRKEKSEALERWQDAKFGMFIHWGIYAVPAGVYNGTPINHIGEWIMRDAKIPKTDYAKYSKDFAPEGYDPAPWVDLALRAGMKYVVMTAKHHDGFALFDSKVSDWDAVDATPGKRDLLMPMVLECRKQGMPLGFHYSQAVDWWHPGGGQFGETWDKTQVGSFDAYLTKIALPQVKELVTRYGPVASFFFDTPVGMNYQRGSAFEAVLPAYTMYNDRLYGGSGTYLTYEGRLPPAPDRQRPWELCLSINDTWGYKSTDHNWKSTATLLRTLIDSVSQGGNVLLNVGPDAKGKIPEPAVNVLREIGEWMAKYGESIHNTQRSPYWPIPWRGGCTVTTLPDGNTAMYATLYEWPDDQILRLPGLTNEIVSANILSNSGVVETLRRGNSAMLRLPASPGNGINVIKLILKGRPVIEAAAEEPGATGRLELRAEMSVLTGKELQLERQQDSAEINIGYWKSVEDSAAWRIKLPEAGRYQCVWDIACDAESAGAVLAIVNERSEELGLFRVPATGSWKSFRTIGGETLDLPAGETELRLIPREKPGLGVVNLRSLTLNKKP